MCLRVRAEGGGPKGRVAKQIIHDHLHAQNIQAACPITHAGVEGWLVRQELVRHLDEAEIKAGTFSQVPPLPSSALPVIRLLTLFMRK